MTGIKIPLAAPLLVTWPSGHNELATELYISEDLKRAQLVNRLGKRITTEGMGPEPASIRPFNMDDEMVREGNGWEDDDGSVLVSGGRIIMRAEGKNEPVDLGDATVENMQRVAAKLGLSPYNHEVAEKVAWILHPHGKPVTEPELIDDGAILLVPNADGTGNYPVELSGPDIIGDSWCLMCEALDPKGWRFPEEVAGRIEWTLCEDHEELTQKRLEHSFVIDALCFLVQKFAPAKDDAVDAHVAKLVDDAMHMDVPSAD